MPEQRNKVDPNVRLTPKGLEILTRLAKEAELPRSVYLEMLIRSTDEEARRQAMFTERNEYDR